MDSVVSNLRPYSFIQYVLGPTSGYMEQYQPSSKVQRNPSPIENTIIDILVKIKLAISRLAMAPIVRKVAHNP